MADTLSADIVIVGSGVAGALIAHQLAMAGAWVLMLERGNVPRWRIVENYRNNPAKDDDMVLYLPSRIAPHPEYKAYPYLPPPQVETEPSGEAQSATSLPAKPWPWLLVPSHRTKMTTDISS